MSDINDIQLRMDLIKMAREILREEYINKRADDHNTWLAQSEQAWRTGRMKLPYPPFVKYPTDEDVVAKALTLYNFVSPMKESAEESHGPTPIVQTTEREIVEPLPALPVQPAEEVTSPVAKTEPERVEESYAKKLLPGWVRRQVGTQ